MKNKLKLLLLSIVLILTSCGNDDDKQKDLVGVWKQTNTQISIIQLTINADLTFTWEEITNGTITYSFNGTYTIDNNLLNLKEGNTTTVYGIQKLTGSTLHLYNNSTGVLYEFSKN